MVEDGLLPEGWGEATIGELYRSWGGMTPSKANPAYWGDGIPWASSQDIKSAHLSSTTYSVTQVALDETRLAVCPVDSVLVVVRSGILAHTLPVSVTDVPVVINQDLKAFDSGDRTLNKWLAAWLRANERQILAENRRDGTTVQSIQYSLLKRRLIPVPPHDEQLRVLGDLEAIDAHRGSIANRLAGTRAAVDRLRASVLAAACSGRLTADWRGGSGDAVDNADRPDAELPTGWSRAQLGDVSRVMLGGTPSRKVAEYWGGNVPWVSSGEVANCRISGTRERITDRGLENSNAKLYPAGTVLIAMIGEGKTRGQAAILDIPAATNQNAAGVQVNREVLDPEFTWRWALSEYERTRSAGRGGNQPALNGQKVRELTIGIPPLDEQREIVRRIDEGLNLIAQIEHAAGAAGSALQAAARGALAQAFRGELVAAVAG